MGSEEESAAGRGCLAIPFAAAAARSISAVVRRRRWCPLGAPAAEAEAAVAVEATGLCEGLEEDDGDGGARPGYLTRSRGGGGSFREDEVT